MSLFQPDTPSFMDAAFAEAEAASKRGEVPVGAVVVRQGEIIARAGNRVEEWSDPSAHAEILALRQAGRLLASPRLIGCDLYVTLEPCPMCAAAISFARIRRLYYGAYDPKSGAVDHGPRFFQQSVCHHAPDVISGLSERRAAAQLRAFFQERR